MSKRLVGIFVLLFCLLVACKQKPLNTLQGLTQGTYYSIKYIGDEQFDLQSQIDSLLDAFDASVSVFNQQSLIVKVNNNEEVVLDDDFKTIFTLSQSISQLTDGAFDITIAPLVDAWGFGAEGLKELDTMKVEALRAVVGWQKVRLVGDSLQKDCPAIKLNMNAIAQGYAVDKLVRFFKSKSLTDFIIDIGGEVYACGNKYGTPWKVGIEMPALNSDSPQTIKTSISLSDMAVVTSGNYRNYHQEEGKRYTHTIDPQSGYPVKSALLSATVIANDAATADAFATAFMVMGIEKTKRFLEQHRQLEVYLIFDQDGLLSCWYSDGFEQYLNQ